MDYEEKIRDFEELLDTVEARAKDTGSNKFFRIWSHHTHTSDVIAAIGKYQINDWLNQFQNNRDKAIAISIFEKIQYYDASTVMDLCRLSYIQWAIKNKTTYESVMFIPLGSAGKSGQMIGYLFRTANNIPVSHMCSELDAESRDLTKVTHIIFLDDFSGTGDQFLKNKCVQTMLANISKMKLNTPKLTFISLVITKDAKEKIETATQIEVISQQIRWKSRYSEDELELIERYGRGLFINKGKDLLWGWGSIAESIVFYHNVPNNTLPIIWSSEYSPVTKKKWIPLFPRTSPNTLRDDEPKTLFYTLANTELYSEDYILYLRMLSDIFASMSEDTFTIQELQKLLKIATALMYPFQEIFEYHTPFSFIHRLRQECIKMVERKIQKAGNPEKADIIDLINLFSVDNEVVDQGLLIRSGCAKIISEILSKNEDYIFTALEYINVPVCRDTEGYINGTLILKIEGVYLALLMLLQTSPGNTNIANLIKKFRINAQNETIKFLSEILLANIENRTKCFSDIDLDNVYRLENIYGKYSVISVTKAKRWGLYNIE